MWCFDFRRRCCICCQKRLTLSCPLVEVLLNSHAYINYTSEYSRTHRVHKGVVLGISIDVCSHRETLVLPPPESTREKKSEASYDSSAGGTALVNFNAFDMPMLTSCLDSLNPVTHQCHFSVSRSSLGSGKKCIETEKNKSRRQPSEINWNSGARIFLEKSLEAMEIRCTGRWRVKTPLTEVSNSLQTVTKRDESRWTQYSGLRTDSASTFSIRSYFIGSIPHFTPTSLLLNVKYKQASDWSLGSFGGRRLTEGENTGGCNCEWGIDYGTTRGFAPSFP